MIPTPGGPGRADAGPPHPPYDLAFYGIGRRTGELRSSREPRWARLRQRIEEQGVGPEDVVVVDYNSSDVKAESGIVVSRNGPIFEFTHDYWKDASGRAIAAPEDAIVSVFHEIRDLLQRAASTDLELGRHALQKESPEDGGDTVGVPGVEDGDIDFYEIGKRTSELRSSEAFQWVRLRQRLETEALVPAHAVVVGYRRTEADVECALIVTREGRILEFTSNRSRGEEPISVFADVEQRRTADFDVEIKQAARVLAVEGWQPGRS